MDIDQHHLLIGSSSHQNGEFEVAGEDLVLSAEAHCWIGVAGLPDVHLALVSCRHNCVHSRYKMQGTDACVMPADVCDLGAPQVEGLDGAVEESDIEVVVLVAPGALEGGAGELVGHFLEDGGAELSLLEGEDSEFAIPGGGGEVVGELLVGPGDAGDGVVVAGHALVGLDVVLVVVEAGVSSQKSHIFILLSLILKYHLKPTLLKTDQLLLHHRFSSEKHPILFHGCPQHI